MAYLSLYRKYRSQTFAEVVGQEHVTTTLSNAITSGRLHHAYLFTGPRGTGKTSTARILAKALNCEYGPTAIPCNNCAQCESITAGSNVDVIEIDAASHGGVEDVRDLRERVTLAPAAARTKVYIVDECHMLSSAGWNAFLKTVEEPPGHVLFVFATTEPHKVPATILSRTQRFDLKRLNSADLARHVTMIGDREGLAFEPGAIDLVVRAGDGSARDTLSVLDQVMAFTGSKITVEGVSEVLGTVGDQVLSDIAERIGTGDVPGLLTAVQRLADDGQDLRQLARDAVEYLRSLLLLQAAPDADLVDTTPERLARLTAQAARLGRVELVRAIDLIAEAQAQMRRGNTRLPLELALVKAALPEASGDPAALAARLDRLERRATAPVTAPVSMAVAIPTLEPEPERELVPEPEPVTSRSLAPSARTAPTASSLDAVRTAWPRVLDGVRARSVRLGAQFSSGQPVSLRGDALTVQFPYAFHAESCSTDQARATIQRVFSEILGMPLQLVAEVSDRVAPAVAERQDAQRADEDETVLEAESIPAIDQRFGGHADARAIETLTQNLGAKILEEQAWD